jgi:hypothetical protein
VVTNARAYYTTRAAAGALDTRLSLRPLLSRGTNFLQSSGASRREIAAICLRARTEGQRQRPIRRYRDLPLDKMPRFRQNIGKDRRTRSGGGKAAALAGRLASKPALGMAGG